MGITERAAQTILADLEVELPAQDQGRSAQHLWREHPRAVPAPGGSRSSHRGLAQPLRLTCRSSNATRFAQGCAGDATGAARLARSQPHHASRHLAGPVAPQHGSTSHRLRRHRRRMSDLRLDRLHSAVVRRSTRRVRLTPASPQVGGPRSTRSAWRSCRDDCSPPGCSRGSSQSQRVVLLPRRCGGLDRPGRPGRGTREPARRVRRLHTGRRKQALQWVKAAKTTLDPAAADREDRGSGAGWRVSVLNAPTAPELEHCGPASRSSPSAMLR